MFPSGNLVKFESLYCLTIAAFPNGPTLTVTAKQCQPVSNTSFDNDDQAEICANRKVRPDVTWCNIFNGRSSECIFDYSIFVNTNCWWYLLIVENTLCGLCVYTTAVCFTQKCLNMHARQYKHRYGNNQNQLGEYIHGCLFIGLYLYIHTITPGIAERWRTSRPSCWS